jgi:hypothetical protein
MSTADMMDATLTSLAPYRHLFFLERNWCYFYLYVLVIMARCQRSCLKGLISEFLQNACLYDRFLRLFCILAANPEDLEAVRVRDCLKLFPQEEGLVLLVDSTIVCKESWRVPGVSSRVQ